MWFDESVFYQIYPLGFCGAERENDFGEVRHRLGKIEAEIPRLKEMGVTAVLFNPLFESERHGYDTVDFYKIDRRLGTNDEFKALVKKFHEAGIRVVLDGVFNHTGRAFAPFQEVLAKREATDYRFWFNINFYGNSAYNDGLDYENWEGHPELVKLRLDNWDLQKYLMDAVRFWIKEFDIDGLRLDVCYLLPPWFMELLRRTVNECKSDFFLVGEVIHCGNFGQNICPERLNSITNYECFKGMVSAFNSDNLFEIESSLTRLFSSQPWALYTGKRMLNFVDNHDVIRAYTALKEKRNLLNLYTLLFTIPGIPCVYYGSEFGIEGDKSDLDYKLRPCIDEVDKYAHADLVERIRKLSEIRKNSKALSYGGYYKATIQNRNFSFVREWEGEKIIVAVNIADSDCTVRVEEAGKGRLAYGASAQLKRYILAAFYSGDLQKELSAMENFVDERDYKILENNKYTFSVLNRIMGGKCELLLTDHERLIVCFSGRPAPVWIWTADGADEKEMERAYQLAKEYSLLDGEHRFNVKYDLAHYFIKRAAADNKKLSIFTNMYVYDCHKLIKPTGIADGSMHYCNSDDIDELTEIVDLFHKETGIDQTDRNSYRLQAEARINAGNMYFWKDSQGNNVASCNFAPNGNMASIGLVFTRPEFRRKHYAENLVYRVTKLVMDAGYVPMLYTNADYAASNACYMKIGYVQKGELCTIG